MLGNGAKAPRTVCSNMFASTRKSTRVESAPPMFVASSRQGPNGTRQDLKGCGLSFVYLLHMDETAPHGLDLDI